MRLDNEHTIGPDVAHFVSVPPGKHRAHSPIHTPDFILRNVSPNNGTADPSKSAKLHYEEHGFRSELRLY